MKRSLVKIASEMVDNHNYCYVLIQIVVLFSHKIYFVDFLFCFVVCLAGHVKTCLDDLWMNPLTGQQSCVVTATRRLRRWTSN